MLRQKLLQGKEIVLHLNAGKAVQLLRCHALPPVKGAGRATVEHQITLQQRQEVQMTPLCKVGESRALVLFYRADVLDTILRRREAQMLLRRYGYRPSDSLSAMLGRLRRRVQSSAIAGAGFPHEIGLFLGYPPHDVRGFIEHKGRGFLCCGLWKVYADADTSTTLFKRYADCTARFCTRLASGVPMADILEAV